jgi:hypothetical protein
MWLFTSVEIYREGDRHVGRHLTDLFGQNRDPLRELCDAVMAATVCLYNQHALVVPDHVTVGLRVHVDHDPISVHKDITSPFKGVASVAPGCRVDRCCADAENHWQTLRLTLLTPSFDQYTLSALPFVLFHERVSHVLQGPWSAQRPVPDIGSAFAEGWMDLAAWHVFKHALRHYESACGPHVLVPHPYSREFFQAGGRREREARHPAGSHELVGAAASRREGWEAATQTLEAMREYRFPDATSTIPVAVVTPDNDPHGLPLVVGEYKESHRGLSWQIALGQQRQLKRVLSRTPAVCLLALPSANAKPIWQVVQDFVLATRGSAGVAVMSEMFDPQINQATTSHGLRYVVTDGLQPAAVGEMISSVARQPRLGAY